MNEDVFPWAAWVRTLQGAPTQEDNAALGKLISRPEPMEAAAERDAEWARVWATLTAAIWFVRVHGRDELKQRLDQADAWLAAHAPKEPTK